MLKRFEREAKSLAKLSHPSIVKVYDYGEHDDSPYLVMEYLPGGTLKKFLGKPISWQDAVRLILPVARGIAYAHQRGVLHRDIKPANILITESGEPMLSDFGIAKLFEADQTTALTGSGMAIGTPDYMAPEQWTGTTSVQSDLYSLGIVLYEMVAGRKPYIADTPAAILLKQATEPLPSPCQFAADVPEALELILIKTLAKEPEDRYEDLDVFIEALESLHVSVPLEYGQVEDIPEIPAARIEKPVAGDVVEPQAAKASLPVKIQPYLGWVMGGVVIILAMWLGSPLMGKLIASPSAATATFTSTVPVTPIEPIQTSDVFTPGVTKTEIGSPTPADLAVEFKDAKGVTMRLVPAGQFTMGMNVDDAFSVCQIMFTDCTREQFIDEDPSYILDLEDYYIDQYEVTNVNYKACVDAGGCQPPISMTSGVGNTTRPDYYENPRYDNYPVVHVSWDMAQTYCEWRGARLPTEVEWEKAARGTDARIFPWGSTMVDSTFANYDLALGDTWMVGSYENGQSPYGIYDLAGNVDEWVADWYAAYPGQGSEASKNFGETYRVVRGGNWDSNEVSISTVNRDWRNPSLDGPFTGFRCAKDAP